MMYFLNVLPFLILVTLTGACSVQNRRPFGKNLPLSMIVVGFVLFVSQMTGCSFQYGFFLISVAAGIGMLYCVRGLMQKDLKNLILSDGFFVFLSVFVLFLLMDYGRRFTAWDEFMHWGKMVKEMLRTDRFYCADTSALVRHKDYPPFVSLFEFFWCRYAGGYSEASVTLSLHVFQLSLVVPYVMDTVKPGGRAFIRFLRGLLYAAGFAVFIIFLDGFGSFSTVYADILVGLFFAFCMYLVYSGDACEDPWGCLTYVLAMVSMLYAKQIGAAFCVICLCYYAGVLKKRNNRTDRSVISACAVLCAVLAAAFLVWNLYVARYDVARQFDVRKVDPLLFLVYLKYPGTEHDIILRFVKALFTKQIITGWIPVSFAAAIVIGAVVLQLLHAADRVSFPKQEKDLLSLIFAGGAVWYALVLVLLYVFCFEQWETETLNSFPRYMGSYFLGESFVLLAVYLSTVKKNQPGHNGGKWFGWMIFAAMVIMTPKNLTKLIPQYFVKDTGYLTIVPEYQIQAEYLNECVEEGARVEVVDTLERQDRDLVFLGYYTDGIFVNVSYMDVLNIDYEQDEEKRRAFMERLVKADYLYVKETSASFDGYFSRYNQDQPFRKGEVLRVLHEASGIVFQPVQ